MKILVTGGAGYIGSHFVNYLINHGFNPSNIIVIDNLVYGHKEFLPPKVSFIKGDLLNKYLINSIFLENKIDCVIHFAGYIKADESMKNPCKYFENNIYSGLNLLEAMLKGGCKKIIFSSSCAIYGIPEKIPIKENVAQNPINPYGESKLMFEKILIWYNKVYGIRSVRLRYFNAAGAGYGIGEKHVPETHLIPLILKTARGERESISVLGTDYETPDGTCIRDYIHVIDLANAHFKAMELLDKKKFETDCYNIGTGKSVSVLEVINISKKITGKNFKVKKEKRRHGDSAYLVADCVRANRVLNWKAQYDIEKIIKDAWNWHNK